MDSVTQNKSGTIRYIRHGFLLVFYSMVWYGILEFNVPCSIVTLSIRYAPFMRYLTCNYTVTLNWGYGSLKVMGTVMDRFATYDFLLTFHSNHGPISYHFQDIRWFLSTIPKFSRPLLFCVPNDWISLGIGYRRWGQKARMMGLPGRQRSLTISSAVWIECTNVTDRQTDRLSS